MKSETHRDQCPGMTFTYTSQQLEEVPDNTCPVPMTAFQNGSPRRKESECIMNHFHTDHLDVITLLLQGKHFGIVMGYYIPAGLSD